MHDVTGFAWKFNTAFLDPSWWCAIPREMQSANTGREVTMYEKHVGKLNQCRDMTRCLKEDAEYNATSCGQGTWRRGRHPGALPARGWFNLLLRRSSGRIEMKTQVVM